MAGDAIRFHYRGKLHTITGQDTTRTVLQYLREDLGHTGTKEGCAEGDCGACTVVVAEPNPQGELEFRAVNSCIQFLPTLDGKALFTVEDLRNTDGSLHPVQQSLVDHHGSQCGFCTPGFVMSLWGLYLTHSPDQVDRHAINEALSGNLCRCTGYRPIITAATEMFNYPKAEFDIAGLANILKTIQRTDVFSYEHDDHIFHAPHSPDQLAELRLQYPDARILAGSTDVGLWVTKQYRDLPHLIYIGKIPELRAIKMEGKDLYIAAGALLNEAYPALIEYIPELSEFHQRFASHPIRNAGTLGGNVANGSPIGDSMPALIALGTQIILRHGTAEREMPLEDFYLAYQKNALQPGEFVLGLRVPVQQDQRKFRAYKISKRFDQDISAVCAAFAVELDAAGKVSQLRTGFGGVAATPVRAIRVEQALLGQAWTEENVQLAMRLMADDFQPLTDMRASSEYRLLAAQNLLYRFYLETAVQPLPAEQVHVVDFANLN